MFDSRYEKYRKRAKLDVGSLERSKKDIWDMVEYRLLQKGEHTYASKHEILGLIEEERHELIEVIQKNEPKEEVIKELIDIAVACLFGVASLHSDTVDW